MADIPEYFLRRKINHFSPTQEAMPDDQYVYKYLQCSQEKRRMFKGSAKMHAGVQVGLGIEKWLTLGEDMKPKSLRVYPTSDEKEKLQHEQNQESFMDTLNNVYRAVKEIGMLSEEKIIFENYVSGELDGVVIPVIGRTDIETRRYTIELKTKWRVRGREKKDGTRSYTKSKAPDQPDFNHLKQLAFYHTFQPKVKSFLVYACEREEGGYKIFDIDEHHPKDLMHEFRLSLLVKQNLAAVPDPRLFVRPDWKHFGWDIGEEFYKEAREYYGYN